MRRERTKRGTHNEVGIDWGWKRQNGRGGGEESGVVRSSVGIFTGGIEGGHVIY